MQRPRRKERAFFVSGLAFKPALSLSDSPSNSPRNAERFEIAVLGWKKSHSKMPAVDRLSARMQQIGEGPTRPFPTSRFSCMAPVHL